MFCWSLPLLQCRKMVIAIDIVIEIARHKTIDL